jgi:phenylacetic acid degradation operon negative regulatory protein
MPTDAAELKAARAPLIAGARAGSPPGLLLMLMGDYWLESAGVVPSAALVSLLGDFGVNDAASRAALSRMVKRGLLVSTKSGRNTAYRATPRGQEVLRAASRRIVEFGASGASWSGVWSIVAFELPENARSLRAAVRNRLGWLGFAPLYDEVWICPHDRHEEAVRELSSLGVTATPFQASMLESAMPTRPPQTAWDLAELEGRYRDFIERAEAALDERVRVPCCSKPTPNSARSPSNACARRSRNTTKRQPLTSNNASPRTGPASPSEPSTWGSAPR